MIESSFCFFQAIWWAWHQSSCRHGGGRGKSMKETGLSPMRSLMPCFQRDTRSLCFSYCIWFSSGNNHNIKYSPHWYLASLQVLPPPAGYVPIRTPARKLSATPTPIGGMTGFHMQAEDRTVKQMNDQPSGNLPFLKPDDIQYFDKLLVSNAISYVTTILRAGGFFCLKFNVCIEGHLCMFV